MVALGGTLSDPSVIAINELYSVSQPVSVDDSQTDVGRLGQDVTWSVGISLDSSHDSNVDILYVYKYNVHYYEKVAHTYTVVVVASCSKGYDVIVVIMFRAVIIPMALYILNRNPHLS